ncbi:conjugal transfer protein TraF [Ferrimonas sediminum]|nr:conjugal transfer protein TraF [Ferrimonas sediminum]
MMKLSVLSLALAAVAAPAVAVVGMDAKSGGAANTGIASGDFTRAPLNPALLTKFKDSDDLYLRLGAGVLAKEYEDALDQVDATQDAIDAFEAKIDAMDPANPPTQADADALIKELQALDDTTLVGEANVDFGVYVPSKSLGFGVTIGGYVVANGDFNYDDADGQLVNDALTSGVFDPDNLKSEGIAHAVAVSELALSFAHQANLPRVGDIAFGLAAKYQRFDSYLYTANINNYDNDDYFDDQYMNDKTAFNMDLGIYKPYGNWSFALVARNLIKQSIKNIDGDKVSLDPTVAGAVAWSQGMFTGTMELDLIEDESFVVEGDAPQLLLARQYARAGMEVDFSHLQLRAGYQTDLSGNYGDLLTVGLGISPWDTISLDLAGQFGDDDERGAMLQLGVKL